MNSVNFKTNHAVIGEFAYFDSRIKNDNSLSRRNHYLVKTEKSSGVVGCHYSLPDSINNQNFITNHGKIIEIIKNK